MSLESKIDKLTAAIEVLTAAMNNGSAAPVAVESTPAAPVEPAAPAAVSPTPPVTAPTPEPAAPVVTDTPALAAADALPFTDHDGLMKYIMGKYQALGAEKGAQIQSILQGLGYANVNEVAAERYMEFYEKVEAIQ